MDLRGETVSADGQAQAGNHTIGMKPPALVITSGEPAGIGPELVAMLAQGCEVQKHAWEDSTARLRRNQTVGGVNLCVRTTPLLSNHPLNLRRGLQPIHPLLQRILLQVGPSESFNQ